MTQVRRTTLAAEDLHRIIRRIRDSNPAASLHVAKTLYVRCLSLDTLPNRGRIGGIAGTRELVFGRFIIVYRVKADAVEMLLFYHAAQNWP